MKFLDLSVSCQSKEGVAPVHCASVKPKRVKGHPMAFAYKMELITEITEGSLPKLPALFNAQRKSVLEANGGGARVSVKADKFTRKGALTIAALRDGQPDFEDAPSAEQQCVVHLAHLQASEGKVRMRWLVTVTATTEEAGQWLELSERDVHVAFKLAEGNTQLAMFGDRKQPELVPDSDEAAA